MSAPLWQVAVPTPLRKAYVYAVPEALGRPVQGARVLAPFGGRRVTGYLIEPAPTPPDGRFKIKPVIAILDEQPAVSEELFGFLVEAAAYYMHPLGEVLRSALPAGTDYREKKGELKKPRMGKRLYRLVRPTDRATPEAVAALARRAPKRAAVLEAIAAEGKVDLADLGAAGKGASGLVRQLAEDGLAAVEELERPADRFLGPPVARDVPPPLNAEQEAATRAIVDQLGRGGYRGFLLHGVTGSGKTEVYLRAIAAAREQGRGALVLVPEIALTPQLVGRYRARFGDDLAVLHSGLTDRERFDQWQLLRSGQIRVAIGVRSAIFAPVERLGIVVVDEEHDSSFKQERGFHYHARDLALLRAARAGATAVLGSATPSLESHHNAGSGKLGRLVLRARITDRPLPEVSIVDMTGHRSGPGGQRVITQPLFEAIRNCLDRGEQAILFLNRRGFAPALLCSACGEIPRCGDCAVSLTLHRRPRALLCHYCGARRPIPERCPKCGAGELAPVGSGTEKAEALASELFPGARVGRLDRDAAAGGQIEAILDKLRRGELDILVGTQMVTKGHDFPRVTLVGVLNADVGLHLPDFRAEERSFQLLTQVAGRSGRSELGGRAIIQTFHPGHPAIDLARTHDYDRFAALAIESRRELGYPPFGRLAALRLSSTDENKVHAAAIAIFTQLRNIQDKQGASAVTMLGPVPAPISRIQGRSRWRILLRAPRQDQIRALLAPLIPRIEAPPAGVRITLDIDPISML